MEGVSRHGRASMNDILLAAGSRKAARNDEVVNTLQSILCAPPSDASRHSGLSRLPVEGFGGTVAGIISSATISVIRIPRDAMSPLAHSVRRGHAHPPRTRPDARTFTGSATVKIMPATTDPMLLHRVERCTHVVVGPARDDLCPRHVADRHLRCEHRYLGGCGPTLVPRSRHAKGGGLSSWARD